MYEFERKLKENNKNKMFTSRQANVGASENKGTVGPSLSDRFNIIGTARVDILVEGAKHQGLRMATARVCPI